MLCAGAQPTAAVARKTELEDTKCGLGARKPTGTAALVGIAVANFSTQLAHPSARNQGPANFACTEF